MKLRNIILPSYMHNTSSSQTFLTFLGSTIPWEPISLILCHGSRASPWWLDDGVMFLFHASTSLSILLLYIYLVSFLLCKLFNSLYLRVASKEDVKVHNANSEKITQGERKLPSVLDKHFETNDLIADIVLGGDGLLFLSEKSWSSDALLVKQGNDSSEEATFEAEGDAFVSESVYGSPLEDLLPQEKVGTEHNSDDVLVVDAQTPSDCPSPFVSSSSNAAFDGEDMEREASKQIEESDFLEEKQLIIIDHSHYGSRKFAHNEFHGGKHNYGESLTGESTSKSSVEWRSSTVLRDSETEYPFSSSSRRSSSRWESYTMFRKYDEDMLFFDRISMQKLHETAETLRSIKVQPRSISQRIVHRLMAKHKQFPNRSRNPYEELESAYVAQICLAWEALNWNYNSFQQTKTDHKNTVEDTGCAAQVAQEFQQFQVLLQRFIESEPYEHGRRPEVFARVRISSPKLLQVPEFREGDESKGDTNLRISSAEFLGILEDAIRTFFNFLKADKESHCEVFRALVRKKSNCADQTYLDLIKRATKKKKLRLKDFGRRRKCFRMRKAMEAQETEILMALIDMKVVSRVLRMAEITEEQLHWCEEKMNKVRIWDGKIQRDSSPLFFPVH